jgi:hypothetical protein
MAFGDPARARLRPGRLPSRLVGRRGNVAGLTTRFRIDRGVLEPLRDEVIDFWSSRNLTLIGSRFRE